MLFFSASLDAFLRVVIFGHLRALAAQHLQKTWGRCPSSTTILGFCSTTCKKGGQQLGGQKKRHQHRLKTPHLPHNSKGSAPQFLDSFKDAAIDGHLKFPEMAESAKHPPKPSRAALKVSTWIHSQKRPKSYKKSHKSSRTSMLKLSLSWIPRNWWLGSLGRSCLQNHLRHPFGWCGHRAPV